MDPIITSILIKLREARDMKQTNCHLNTNQTDLEAYRKSIS